MIYEQIHELSLLWADVEKEEVDSLNSTQPCMQALGHSIKITGYKAQISTFLVVATMTFKVHSTPKSLQRVASRLYCM